MSIQELLLKPNLRYGESGRPGTNTCARLAKTLGSRACGIEGLSQIKAAKSIRHGVFRFILITSQRCNEDSSLAIRGGL